MNAIQLTSRFNPQLEVSVFQGHFATRHSHNSHYIDITRTSSPWPGKLP